jgi:hypothetical protein
MAAVEVAVMFALMMLFIWKLRALWPLAWVPVVGLIAISNAQHGETPKTLGLSWQTFGSGLRPGLLIIATVSGLALVLALIFGTLRTVAVGPALGGIALYCFWGLFQQYLLNGFFVTRLRQLPWPRHAPQAVAAGLFSLLHLPNPLLMAITLLGGFLGAEFYLRYRNLLFLGLAHGILGTIVFLVFPDAISHHLRVGPGYIAYCRYYCGGAHLWLAWML